MSDQDTKTLARIKVNRAIKLIEQAELLLSAACAELCPIVNAYDQWKLVGDQYDEVRALSRKIAYTIPMDSVDLDADAKRALSKAGR